MHHLPRLIVHLCLAMGALLVLIGCQPDKPTVSPLVSMLPTPGADDFTEVTIYETAGMGCAPVDPSKHDEQITARRAGDAYELLVSSQLCRLYQQETAPLTHAEWATLMTVIQQANLMQFTPQPAGQALDTGIRGFEIKGTRSMSQTWSIPLVDEQPYYALLQYLGRLAQDKVPQLPMRLLKPG
jgi:hypothetical protein